MSNWAKGALIDPDLFDEIPPDTIVWVETNNEYRGGPGLFGDLYWPEHRGVTVYNLEVTEASPEARKRQVEAQRQANQSKALEAFSTLLDL